MSEPWSLDLPETIVALRVIDSERLLVIGDKGGQWIVEGDPAAGGTVRKLDPNLEGQN